MSRLGGVQMDMGLWRCRCELYNVCRVGSSQPIDEIEKISLHVRIVQSRQTSQFSVLVEPWQHEAPEMHHMPSINESGARSVLLSPHAGLDRFVLEQARRRQRLSRILYR